jgi:MFS transporter, ACS family, allantoate permease
MADNINTHGSAANRHSIGDTSVLKTDVADEGYELFEEAEPQAMSAEAADSVRRKLDAHLLPLMCLLYGLNYVDKVAMGWAVLFDFRQDLGLRGDQYSWASSMFYFGYLVAQYPANYILQRSKTAKVLSAAVISWGVLMLA